MPGNAAYAVGLDDTPVHEDGSLIDASGLDAIAERTTAYVERALPGLHPEPVEVRHCWVTELPWSPDGFAAWELGGLLILAGNHLFKHAPAVGRELARAALGEGLAPSLHPEARLGRGAVRDQPVSEPPAGGWAAVGGEAGTGRGAGACGADACVGAAGDGAAAAGGAAMATVAPPRSPSSGKRSAASSASENSAVATFRTSSIRRPRSAHTASVSVSSWRSLRFASSVIATALAAASATHLLRLGPRPAGDLGRLLVGDLQDRGGLLAHALDLRLDGRRRQPASRSSSISRSSAARCSSTASRS